MEFVILPDSVAGKSIADTICARSPAEVIPHASGRPWIVGRWSEEDVVWGESGGRRVAILGCAPVTADDLAEALARVRGIGDLDALAGTLPGSFHLVASAEGRVRAQGTVSSACQIFYTRLAGTTVAADRPQTLASLAGTGIDEELLGMRLLAPWPPWPLGEYCLWRGVNALPVGCYLELDPYGYGRVVRWWTPPSPTIPLSAGAELVRTALRDAVKARTFPREAVSADLSGGMDSTSLCFLAAGSAVRLVTTRWQAADPADEDRGWADRAAAAMPDAEHLVLSRRDAPIWFADLMTPDPDVEAPFAWIRTRAQLAYQAQQVAARGSTRHLTGHGGDELFLATPLFLHTLVRTGLWSSLRYLRANRALYRWRLGATVRALMDSSSFARWLGESARSLTAPLGEFSGQPDFGWGISSRMPTWATAEAVATARRLLREAAIAGPEPLHPLRAQHAALQDVRLCGDTLRRVNRLTCGHGVSWHAPYLDDRVLEAAMSIRFEDRAQPGQYKPALVAAMRGVVPDAILGRSTKSEYSAEAYEGIRRYRPELLELCDDMRLAKLGLVDADALRSILLCPPPSSLTLVPLISTFACEVWLRSLSATASVNVSVGGPR